MSHHTQAVAVQARIYHFDITPDEEHHDEHQEGEHAAGVGSAVFTARCRELPAAVGRGRTGDEAVAGGRDAVEAALAALDRQGRFRRPWVEAERRHGEGAR
jgi:hypothetical protein